MDNEVVSSLQKLAKIIAADSQSNEEQILAELGSVVRPFVEECQRRTGDARLAKRAIDYVAYTHAFPRAGASVNTFMAMLEALLEVALPVAVQDGSDSEFLKDMRNGIRRAGEIVDEMKNGDGSA